MRTFEEIKAEYDALAKELVEVGNRLGATAGIMPFVKAGPNFRVDYDRYSEIWDRMSALRREALSN
jgi:hypothetical protein